MPRDFVIWFPAVRPQIIGKRSKGDDHGGYHTAAGFHRGGRSGAGRDRGARGAAISRRIRGTGHRAGLCPRRRGDPGHRSGGLFHPRPRRARHADHALEWNGATWHFASADNRAAFADDPGAYAPQYGGFCAWAVAEKGKLYSTQPDNWAIIDGKLYLNYNDDIQERWQAGHPRLHRRGRCPLAGNPESGFLSPITPTARADFGA